MDEIVDRVRSDDEIIGRVQLNGSPEVAEAEGYSAAEVDVTRVTEKADAGVDLVLDPVAGVHRRNSSCIHIGRYEDRSRNGIGVQF